MPGLAAAMDRHVSIEPENGHMRTDGCLARWGLKGTFDDAVFAVQGGSGSNIGRILAHLRAMPAQILALMLDLVRQYGTTDAATQLPDRAV